MDHKRALEVFSVGEDVWKGEFILANSKKSLVRSQCRGVSHAGRDEVAFKLNLGQDTQFITNY